MNINELTEVIKALAPDAKFSVWGKEGAYMGETPPLEYGDFFIDWRSGGQFPTDKDIDDKYTEVKIELNKQQIREKRASEYPTIEELTVALWEKTVENNDEMLQELQAKREQVKQDNPFPDAE